MTPSEATLVSTLARFEILVVMRERTPLPRAVLEELPNLRFVVTTGTRNASLDAAYLAERDIPVSGTEVGGPDGGVSPPNEIAWGLIFATVKRVAAEDRAVRAGIWQAGVVGRLAGTTLGLVGLGRLGAEMVPPARAFGMHVIAWSENLSRERVKDVGVELVTKSELLKRADIVSLHLVLSDRSRATIGAAELLMMKPTAVLINTSRGPIVEESALVDALRSGKVGGAGLDVYDIEPLSHTHPFLTLENVVLSPHLGYTGEGPFRIMYGQCVENIAAFLHGAHLRPLELTARTADLPPDLRPVT